jgi:hypothetical protein
MQYYTFFPETRFSARFTPNGAISFELIKIANSTYCVERGMNLREEQVDENFHLGD